MKYITELYHNLVNGKCLWCGLIPPFTEVCEKTTEELKKQKFKENRAKITIIKGNKTI